MLKPPILTLLASATLALAFPGGTSGYAAPPKETTAYPLPPAAKETICTTQYFGTTVVEEGTTTYFSTQTVVVPITTVVDAPTTGVEPFPYTSTGYTTKTYSTVITIVDTIVESDVKTDTQFETIPTSSVGTSYVTSVGTIRETVRYYPNEQFYLHRDCKDSDHVRVSCIYDNLHDKR